MTPHSRSDNEIFSDPIGGYHLELAESAQPLLPLVSHLIERQGRTGETVKIVARVEQEMNGFSIAAETQDDGSIRIGVRAADRACLSRADLRLARLIEHDSLTIEFVLNEHPAVTNRALMECFYGPTWRDSERRWLMEVGVERGINLYIYGPAGDPHTGTAWNRLYSDIAIGRLAGLAESAKSLGITMGWRVSPSAPLHPEEGIRFSDSTDVDLLVQKCRQIREAGAGHLLVAFDDIAGQFYHQEDREALGDTPAAMANAHATTANILHRHFAVSGCRVTLCPTEYWGIEPSAYRKVLSEALDPEIDVWWTGRQVVSPQITSTDAAIVREHYGDHRLWLWDNYPVNDWGAAPLTHGGAVADDLLFLGPLKGREPAVTDYLEGYAVQGAVQASVTYPALMAAAEWSWNPNEYIAEEVWRSAIAEISNGDDAFAMFAQLQRTSPLSPAADSPLHPLVWRYLLEVDTGAAASSSGKDLAICLDEIESVIRQVQSRDSRLTLAIRPWTERLLSETEAASTALAMIEAIRTENTDQLRELGRKFRDRLPRGGYGNPLVAGGALSALIERGRNLAGTAGPPAGIGSPRKVMERENLG